MKKIICLVVVVLMIATVAIAAKKMVIDKNNLASLKGTWAGTLSFGMMEAGGTSPATLEILTDTAPVKGKFTIQNIPKQVADGFGIQSGQHSAEADGVITSQGTLLWTGAASNFVEAAIKSEGKALWVTYFFRGMKGEGTFKKK